MANISNLSVYLSQSPFGHVLLTQM